MPDHLPPCKPVVFWLTISIVFVTVDVIGCSVIDPVTSGISSDLTDPVVINAIFEVLRSDLALAMVRLGWLSMLEYVVSVGAVCYSLG